MIFFVEITSNNQLVQFFWKEKMYAVLITV